MGLWFGVLGRIGGVNIFSNEFPTESPRVPQLTGVLHGACNSRYMIFRSKSGDEVIVVDLVKPQPFVGQFDTHKLFSEHSDLGITDIRIHKEEDVAIASFNMTALVFSVASAASIEEHFRLSLPKKISSVGISKNIVVTSLIDGSSYVWNKMDGSMVSSFFLQRGAIFSIDITNDGKRVATGAGQDSFYSSEEDFSIWLWRADTGEPLAKITDHSDVISGLCFSGNGQTLTTASWDGTCRKYDLYARERLQIVLIKKYCKPELPSEVLLKVFDFLLD